MQAVVSVQAPVCRHHALQWKPGALQHTANLIIFSMELPLRA